MRKFLYTDFRTLDIGHWYSLVTLVCPKRHVNSVLLFLCLSTLRDLSSVIPFVEVKKVLAETSTSPLVMPSIPVGAETRHLLNVEDGWATSPRWDNCLVKRHFLLASESCLTLYRVSACILSLSLSFQPLHQHLFCVITCILSAFHWFPRDHKWGHSSSSLDTWHCRALRKQRDNL